MKNKNNNKIAIGTAQFSNNYGITNEAFLEFKDLENILKDCKEFGINTLDTAPEYEGVEEKLGKFNLKYFDLITKVSLEKNKKILDENSLKKNIENSFIKLNVQKIYAILIRKPTKLLNNKKLLNIILDYKKKKKICKIGYTLYDISELEVLYSYFRPDIVQIPYSLVDKRFEKRNWINKMYKDDVEIHIRSVFLQGLLLANLKNLPKKFDKYKEFFKRFENWVKKNNISKLQACLVNVLLDKRIKRVIVGINSRQNLYEVNNVRCKELIYPDWLTLSDDYLIDPSKW